MAYDENGDFIQDPYDSTPPPDPYHDPRTYAGYDPYTDPSNYASGGQPTPNQQGGYSSAPPIDTATGTYAPGWSQGANGLWNFTDPSARPTTTAPPNPTNNNYPNIPNPRDYPAPGLPSRPSLPDPLRPWTETFSAPTAEQAASEPGFQFQLGEGLKALERGAAAKGTLLTGGTAKGEAGWATDFANTNYKDVYNRAANEYEGRRTNFLQNEANRFNSQMGVATTGFGMDQSLFGDARTNRMDSWGMGSDYFGMGQAQRMNDFNIWDQGNANSVSNLLKLAMVKKPVSPYGNF